MRWSSKIAWWVGACLALVIGPVASGAEDQPSPSFWAEGTMLKGVDGSLIHDSNDLWFFQLSQEVNDVTPTMAAETRFAILPSAILTHLAVDVNDRQQPRYRLTAHVMQYHGVNFLWLSYYIPLSKLKYAVEPAPVEGGLDPNAIAVDRMDSDEITLPEEVVKRLRDRHAAVGPQRVVSGATPDGRKVPKASTRILVDVVGFIEEPEKGTGCFYFVPDALGQNVAAERYELLPCRALEQTERQVMAWAERTRVKVAGMLTEYQGKKYLLLQRMVRVYNYGNFGG